MKAMWKYKYHAPPPTLRVFYHGEPVAELEQFRQGYIFRYLPRFRELSLSPFPGLPPGKGDVPFEQLPAFFQERLPDMRRPEIQELIRTLGIQKDNQLELLAQLGAHTITDPFELRLAAGV
jgi:HipA-like protein